MKSHFLAALVMGLFASVACGHEAHVHGEAHLDVAVDGPVLSLQLESPLDNLLGFEHEPRNKAERTQAARMAAQLRAAEKLFTPTPAAACVLEQVSLVSSALPPELLGEQKKAQEPDEEEEEEEGHADLDAAWQFRCAHPEALRDLEVRLFSAFSGLRVIEAQVAGPRGQKGASLTPAKRKLSW
jgi:hypothetical protein